MRDRPSHSPAPARPITVQPAVGSHGSCWRRQAKSVVSRDPHHSSAADAPGDGLSTNQDPRGDGRSPHQDQN